MNREAHVRFCERAGLRCPARLTYVEGRLRTREFESKNGGGKRQRAEVVAQRAFSSSGLGLTRPWAAKPKNLWRAKRSHL